MSNAQNQKLPDWAKWNTITDYAKVKKDGINFVILKAINSANNADSKFETHYKGATNAGIEVLATYHYTYATTESEALACAKAWVKVVNGRCKRFILDYEDSTLLKNAKAVTIINTYANYIQSLGYEFLVYAGYSYYNSYLKKYASQINYPFWIARYYNGYNTFKVSDIPNVKYIPVITNTLAGWQYTSSAVINGLTGNSDLSMWYVNTEDVKTNTTTTTTVTEDVTTCKYAEPTLLVTSDTIAKTKKYTNAKYTSSGDSVKWVQWCLWRFGLLLDKDGKLSEKEIDGKCGDRTVQAIIEAQKRLNLTADGIVGSQSRAYFKRVLGLM